MQTNFCCIAKFLFLDDKNIFSIGTEYSTVRFGKSPVNRKMVNYFHHFGESNLGTLLSGERGGVARESLLADTQHSPNSKLLNRAQSSIHLISKLKIKTVRKDIL